MEKYKVNGVEVEFDTFDTVALLLLDDEYERVKKSIEAAENAGKNGATFREGIQAMEAVCEDIEDFFDCVLGEGTSAKVFERGTNYKDHISALIEFVASVGEKQKSLPGELSKIAGTSTAATASTATNRAQRRAEARRKAAAMNENNTV